MEHTKEFHMLRTIGASSFLLAAALAQTNFPPPPTPASNPHTPAKELLGMALFFEEQLSSTGAVACATCHDFAHGGADPRTANARNVGADGLLFTSDDQRGSPGTTIVMSNGSMFAHPFLGFGPTVTSRRAPTVVNTGYHTHLAYDGSKTTLEQLVPAPLFNTAEMGHAGRTWSDVIQRVSDATPLVLASNLPARLQNFIAGQSYPALFQTAFGSAGVTQQRLVAAIACYIRTLNSDQSKWDLVLHNQAALTPQEQQGLQLFTAPANGAVACSVCHADFDNRVLQEGPVAGQMTMVSTGYYGSLVPVRLVFHNIGVRPNGEDPGRYAITSAPNDYGLFRVASLRNVELTGPYFHNGSASTIEQVVEFYNRGGDFHSNQAPSLTPRGYTVTQVDAIAALLRTLTDPRLVAGVQPFDRPTLGSQNGRLVTSIGNGATTTAGGHLVASAPWAPLVGEGWFRLGLTGASVGAHTFLMWDTALGTRSWLDLQLALSPGFQIFATGPAQPLFMMAGGGVQVPVPIPHTPALSGQTLFAQWLVLEPTSNWPMATSNALRIPLL
jgi:cytochrome c peroxidase